MPRITTLKQNVRMQVNNPTGVASPSEARAAGEGYSYLGKAVENAGKVISDIAIDIKDEERKTQKENLELDAALMRGQAEKEAEMGSQDPLGRDKVQLFNDNFQKKMKERIKGEGDPYIQESAAHIFKKQSVLGNLKFLDQAPTDAAKGIDNLRKVNFTKRLGDVSLNPENYMKQMQSNDAELDSLNLTYNETQKENIKLGEKQEIAVSAIRGFMDKEKPDFRSAKLALKNSAQYLGKNYDPIADEIRKNEEHFRDRSLSDYTRGEKMGEDAHKNTRERLALDTLRTMTGLSPGDQKAYMQVVKGIRASGKIEDSDVLSVERAMNPSITKFQPPNATAVGDIVGRITRKESGITDLVQRDMASGRYSANVATELLKLQNLYQGVDNTKNAKKKAEFQQAVDHIESNGGPFTPEKRFDMHKRLTEDTLNGKSPMDSAKGIISKEAHNQLQIKKQVSRPNRELVTFIQSQKDVKSLSNLKPMMQDTVSEYKRTGRSRDGVELLKAYKERMDLLNLSNQEVLNERRR